MGAPPAINHVPERRATDQQEASGSQERTSVQGTAGEGMATDVYTRPRHEDLAVNEALMQLVTHKLDGVVNSVISSVTDSLASQMKEQVDKLE